MKLPDPRDPGELSTLARVRLIAAYAAFSAGDLDDAFELFNDAGRCCAEACRAVGRISAQRKEQR